MAIYFKNMPTKPLNLSYFSSDFLTYVNSLSNKENIKNKNEENIDIKG